MRLFWAENPWPDIKRAAAEGYIVLLPAGALEQHGPMLPVDTDARLAERWARDGAALARDKYGVDCLVLPTLSYGQSCHHMNFPGTISFSFPTYLAALHDILREVVRHGFLKVAVINGNGGNESSLRSAQYQVMEELTREGCRARIALFPGYGSPVISRGLRELQESGLMPSEGQMAIHAAGTETAETLADRPELVKLDDCERPQLERETVPDWAWRTEELSTTGAFGDPSLATAELGEALWNLWAEAVADFLRGLAED